jgi:hypothetical protein
VDAVAIGFTGLTVGVVMNACVGSIVGEGRGAVGGSTGVTVHPQANNPTSIHTIQFKGLLCACILTV